MQQSLMLVRLRNTPLSYVSSLFLDQEKSLLTTGPVSWGIADLLLKFSETLSISSPKLDSGWFLHSSSQKWSRRDGLSGLHLRMKTSRAVIYRKLISCLSRYHSFHLLWLICLHLNMFWLFLSKCNKNIHIFLVKQNRTNKNQVNKK